MWASPEFMAWLADTCSVAQITTVIVLRIQYPVHHNFVGSSLGTRLPWVCEKAPVESFQKNIWSVQTHDSLYIYSSLRPRRRSIICSCHYRDIGCKCIEIH